MRRRIGAFDIINTLILSIVGLVCIVPFLYTFFIAISDGKFLIRGDVSFFPKGVNLQSFIYVFTNPRFDIMTGVRNSAIYTILGTIVSVLLTYSTAYVLTRPRIKCRYLIMSLFVLTWVFDAGMIPRYIAYSSLGFIDNIWVMIIPDAINTQYLIITKAYLEGMPKELEEAAIVDGANDFSILSKIFIPVTKPIIATIALFNGVAIWNQYGGLQIVDRKKDIFKLSQGEYISPDKVTGVYLGCPLVGNLYVYGDSYQSYLVAVVVPSEEHLRAALRERGMEEMEGRSFAELCKDPDVKAVMFEEMGKVADASKLCGFEKVKNIFLDCEHWTIENGMLTPTMKLKRDFSKNHYKEIIQQLYNEGMMKVEN